MAAKAFSIKGMNAHFLKAFSGNLKKLRLAAGLTIRQAAAAVGKKLDGVSAATWCQWEAGARTPHIERLPHIADALGCHVQDLIPWKKGEPRRRAKRK